MELSAITYPNWQAPADDGGMLIWPEASQLLHQTMENHLRLSTNDSVKIQGVPLNELRRQARRWIGHIEESQPLIATGHQTELYHPGVWAKNALIDAVARKLDGQAVHFGVDTDAPKHLHLRWPGGTMPISDDPALLKAEWSGLLASPTPAHASEIRLAVEKSAGAWNFQPAMGPFLDSLRLLGMEQVELSGAMINSAHRLDWDLGLRHQATLVSPIFYSPAYLVLVHHILARAGEFAGHYNAALAEYRRINRVRTVTRPMPNLKIKAEEIEVPFWLDRVDEGRRVRATVRRVGNAYRLVAGEGNEFEFRAEAPAFEVANELGHWLRHRHLRLSPRALTLTMFLRLVLADQFVHGIGGGRYDQINDLLMASHFGFQPPRFSVTTLTLYFPGARGRRRICLSCLKQEGHRLRHSVLGPRKLEMVKSIEELPRGSLQRQEIFSWMHAAMDSATPTDPGLQRWQSELMRAKEQDREDEQFFDRELFYAIQPRERLLGVIERYRQALGG